MVTGVINGREYALDESDAARRVAATEPEPVRDHFVVVSGRRYPPKQALSSLLGIDRADFTTYQARTILRRLGFATGRRSEDPGITDEGWVVRQVPVTDTVEERPSPALRDHAGMWVAIRGEEVVAAGHSPGEVLRALDRAGDVADSMFRVPHDPARDVLGG